MKRILVCVLTALLLALTGCQRINDGIVRTNESHTYNGYPVVYFTSDITSVGLCSVYEALDVPKNGSTAVILSDTTDTLIWTELVEEFSTVLPAPAVIERTLKTDFTGYSRIIVLTQFQPHDDRGFCGAVESTACLIKSPLNLPSMEYEWKELLPEYGKTAADNLQGKLLYINVLGSWGTLSSYDPVALDQACVDLVNMEESNKDFAVHIAECDGIHTLINAEKLGIGSRTYAFLDIDNRVNALR